jgi:hypothetical protein
MDRDIYATSFVMHKRGGCVMVMVGFGSTGVLPHYQDDWVLLSMEGGTHLDSWVWCRRREGWAPYLEVGFGSTRGKEGPTIWMVGFGSAGDKEGPPIWMVGFGSAVEQEGHPIWMVGFGSAVEQEGPLSGWLGLVQPESR